MFKGLKLQSKTTPLPTLYNNYIVQAKDHHAIYNAILFIFNKKKREIQFEKLFIYLYTLLPLTYYYKWKKVFFLTKKANSYIHNLYIYTKKKL